jgi:ubiquitin carboxyl-terminal hydrolase 7
LVEVLVPRDGTFADLLAGLQKKANLEDDIVREMRIFEAHSGKIYKEYQEDAKIAGINEYVTLYAERIPEEELQMQDGERTVNAFSFDREPSRPHGVPFKFVMKPVSISHFLHLAFTSTHTFQGEIFKETKERLSKRTGIKGKQFEKIKFAVVPKSLYSNPRYLDDGKSCIFPSKAEIRRR